MSKKTKFKLFYAVFPIILILIFMSSYVFFYSVQEKNKDLLLQTILRTWHIQNSLKEFLIEDNFAFELSQSANKESLDIRIKEVQRKNFEIAKHLIKELEILRKNCEEISICRYSDYGLLSINNLEGFADAIRNNDFEMARYYNQNSKDFLTLFKFDILNYKGSLSNIDLSRVVALGNHDFILLEKEIAKQKNCKDTNEIFFEDPLFQRICKNLPNLSNITEKTCSTEKLLGQESDCPRSKAYPKQLNL